VLDLDQRPVPVPSSVPPHQLPLHAARAHAPVQQLEEPRSVLELQAELRIAADNLHPSVKLMHG